MGLFNKAQQTIVHCPWANIADNKQAAITSTVQPPVHISPGKQPSINPRDSQCPVHITGRLKTVKASRIAYKIHRQLFLFLTTFFRAPTSLPTQSKLNILIAATGFSTHTRNARRAPLPELFNNPPTTNYIHSDHALLTQKHLFLILLHFCLTMQILHKTQRTSHSCLSLQVCCQQALNLQDQILLQRQSKPYSTCAQHSYMPELITLWKNATEEANK